MSDRKIPKLYYSISDVSKLTGIEAHVLRYWETEFSALSPRKNRGGKRLYREGDIELIQRIQDLLHNQKYTIEGARKKLREPSDKTESRVIDESISGHLGFIREGLMEIRRLLVE